MVKISDLHTITNKMANKVVGRHFYNIIIKYSNKFKIDWTIQTCLN